MSNKKQQKTKQKQKAQLGLSFENTGRKNVFLFLIAILSITFIVYLPSLKNGFTNWDDNVYIPENKLITSLSADNIKKIVDTDNHVSLNYHPITILSYAIDYSISGYNPKVFHTTNLLFHLLNTALVFLLVFQLSDKKLVVAAIASLLFGIHPMHVESVAWIAERKDVLYVFFFLSALIVYLRYLKEQKLILYIVVVILFLLSVLSKAMGIVLPLVLLLIDYYKDRKFDKTILLEKIPFFALSIYFGMLAVSIQSHGALAKFEVFTLFQRISFASYGVVMYIYKLFVPTNLSCFYQYPHIQGDHMPIFFYIVPVIVLALIALTLYLLKRNKTFVFGFCFYLISVAMVLQFISVGKAIIADRYTYLSYMGLFFALAMGYQWLQSTENEKWKNFKIPATGLLVILILFFCYSTVERIKVWENSETLWTDAIEKDPLCEAGYANRGSYRINKSAYDVNITTPQTQNYDSALADFNMAIKLDNNNPKVFTNRANIWGLKQQFELSLQDYSRAIQLDSLDPQTYTNRGVTYGFMKEYDKAIADFNKALSMKPGVVVVIENRAYAYVNSGQHEKAIPELDELIKLNPNKMEYYMYRGVALVNTGKTEAAIADNTKVIQLDANNAQAYFNRSFCYQKLGQYEAALNDALKAKSLGSNVSDEYLQGLRK